MPCLRRSACIHRPVSLSTVLFVVLIALLPLRCAQAETAASSTSKALPTAKQPALAAAAHHPLLRPSERSSAVVFVGNRGQFPSDTLYEAQAGAAQVLLQKTGVTLRIAHPSQVSPVPTAKPAAGAAGAGPAQADDPAKFTVEKQTIQFVGANPDVTVEPLDEQSARVNYFFGKDPSRWISGLKTYARVRYRNLYPGIDMVFYSHNGQLEYDFVVAAGANPDQIRLQIAGGGPMQVTANGELEIGGGKNAVLHRPVLYQNLENGKKLVEGKFVHVADNTVGFQFANYDKSKTFIIDPTINLVYSTYAGGIHDDQAYGLTLDAAGNAYVTGYAASQDFPVTGNALQTARMAIGTYTYDVVVMKFDPSGTLLYSTFLGGSSTELGLAIVVDTAGDAYVGGYTQSSDFPVTQGSFQPTNGGGKDAFLAKIGPDGSQLLYSTYLGGSGDEYIGSLLLNSDGSLWMSGGASAAGLPASATAFQSKPNGVDNYFVAKAQFNQSGALQIPYLTFIGGSNPNEEAFWGELAVDSAGNVYLAGGTESSDYPVTANAYQKPFPLSDGCDNSPMPNSAPILTKFSPDLSKMLYSTVIGGPTEDQNGYPDCNQVALSIHLDSSGNIWLTGTTGMSDFPVTSNAISKQLNGNGLAGVDFFVAELSADGSKELYGTYFGGSQFDYGARGVWDANNNIWIIGDTQSTDFPVTSDALQATNGGSYDTTVTELSPDATKVLYSTYLGGTGDDGISGNGVIALDQAGNVHLAGETASANFPVTPSALQSAFANGDQGPDGADFFYTVLGSGTIGTIGPVFGGNTGDTTLTVDGAGFQQGATCSLVEGGTTIASAQATVNSAGTGINCTFPLNGAATGSYDVVVSNPDGSSFTKKGGFTVQSGGQPTIWADIVGRPKIRNGAPSTFYVQVGNSGSVDAYYVMAWFDFPTALGYSFPQGPAIQDAALVPDPTTGLSATLFTFPVIHAGQTISIPVSLTSTTTQATIPLSVTWRAPWYDSLQAATGALAAAAQNPAGLPTTCQSVASKPYLEDCLGYWTNWGTATVNEFLTTTSPTITTQVETQVVSLFNGYLTAAQSSTPQERSTTMISQARAGVVQPHDGGNSGFFWGWFDGIGDTFGISIPGDQRKQQPAQPVEQPQPCPNGQVTRNCPNPSSYVTCDCNSIPVCQYFADAVTGASCTGAVSVGCQNLLNNQVTPKPNQSCPVGQIPSSRINLANSLHPLSLANLLNAHDGQSCPDPGPGGGGAGGSCGGSGGAIDPNYKAGPSGDGSASLYVNGITPLHYNVGFENEPTATLPAAQVVVTDQLDQTKVDLTTLTLGTISFGSTIINLPSGSTNYATTYSLNTSLSVRIQGSLDSTTGLLKWTFTSIDPSTGLPPTDPTVGFLPPDTDGIVGQGSVLFNVMPKSDQTTGTQVTNMAKVVFDANAAINTPTWMNTLDVDLPGSQVAALPANQVAASGTTSFTVSWSGTDKGSGIASYSVYVSDNGGAFTAWQSNVTTTTASYTGTAGHTYGFYSIATDGAGNVEAAKSQADTTTVVVTSLPPDFSLGATTSSLSIAPGAGGAVTLNVTPINGFNAAVSFACSGLPSESTCSFSPASVTPTGTAAASTTMTITTTAPHGRSSLASTGLSGLAGGSLAAGFLLLPFFYRKRRLGWMLVLLCAVSTIGMIACGGSGSSKPPADPGTPAGASTVTVTASTSGSGAVSHTTTITLTIQ